MRIDMSRKYLIRIFAIVNVLCLILSLLTGCGEGEEVSGNYREVNGASMESATIASNQNYKLLWNEEAGSVLLETSDKSKLWSDILYEDFLEGGTTANGNSPIYITVANTQTLEWNTVRSYSEIPANGKIICKKIDNGIRITYFFDTYEIAVPIDYTLRDDSLLVSINAAQILENGTNYKLVSVSLVPYMCSIANEAHDGYLFIPSGSGALMYTAETAHGLRKYSSEVYGVDAARQVPENFSDDAEIKLPVFGVAGDGTALLGIIEQGAGAALIEAQAGNDRLGYSNVWTTFYLRGYDEYYYESHGTGKGITTRLSDKISTQTLSVAYYPLFDDDANFSGMAEKYRNYLLDRGFLEKSDIDNSAYGITFLGGTNITSSFLGIPNKKLVSLTTFKQAHTVLGQMNAQNGSMPAVRMLGFGDNGIYPGTVIGGKKYPSIYGDKDDIILLQKLCADNNSLLFMDSDIANFSKTGLGFSINADSAQTAIEKRIRHYFFSPIRLADDSYSYSIISRKSLSSATELAIKKAEHYKNFGISLSSIGGMAYSDYNDMKYATKNGIEDDVIKLFSSLKDSGYTTATASANSYAACAAEVLFDTVTDSGDYTAFDQEVPFYQMVFHSYRPMYTEAINLNEDSDRAFATAVAYGMGLGYTLTYDFVAESDFLDTYKLYGTVFEDNNELIKENLVDSGYVDLYDAIKNAVITDYQYISDEVSKTVYSNGTTVYVNHTDTSVSCPAGDLQAFGFIAE